jgi:hypothetical protein
VVFPQAIPEIKNGKVTDKKYGNKVEEKPFPFFKERKGEQEYSPF